VSKKKQQKKQRPVLRGTCDVGRLKEQERQTVAKLVVDG
jgi:hypothetical protein